MGNMGMAEQEFYDKMSRLSERKHVDITKVTALDHGGRAHIFQSDLTGEWYLRLLASNGEIIAATEGHRNYTDIHDVWYKYFPSFKLGEDEDG